MTPHPPVACPACHYQLSQLGVQEGACPECGRSFSIAQLKRLSAAEDTAGLWLITLGALGTAVAQAAGTLVHHMPMAPGGTGGNGAAAAATLSLVPVWMTALGTAALARRTGRTAFQRRWPLLGLVAALSVLLAATQDTAGLWTALGFFQKYPRWVQPYSWVQANRWVAGVSPGLLTLAAAAVLARLSLATGLGSLVRGARVAATAGALAAALFLAASLHGSYVEFLQNRPSSAPTGLSLSSSALTFTLGFLSHMSKLGSEAFLIIVALSISLLRRAAEPQDTLRDTPMDGPLRGP